MLVTLIKDGLIAEVYAHCTGKFNIELHQIPNLCGKTNLV